MEEIWQKTMEKLKLRENSKVTCWYSSLKKFAYIRVLLWKLVIKFDFLSSILWQKGFRNFYRVLSKWSQLTLLVDIMRNFGIIKLVIGFDIGEEMVSVYAMFLESLFVVSLFKHTVSWVVRILWSKLLIGSKMTVLQGYKNNVSRECKLFMYYENSISKKR